MRIDLLRHYLLAALPALLFSEAIHAADFAETKLTPTNGVDGADFGYSVALSGNTFIVGLMKKGNLEGVAYLFDAAS